MSIEIKKEIQLEIAHVLFIDIVGYSKLSINEQRAAIDELTQAVRASEQFQNAEAAGRLIKIPTGDGMALVFYKSPEEPVECVLEISRALKEHAKIKLRMGVHSGPVSGVIDVNGHPNLAGAGLNVAQRVMNCGDAGHILLSKRVADDLGEYEHWRPLLHDLGTCEVKHEARVSIVNLYADEVGNPQLPKKFQTLKKRSVRMRLLTATGTLLALAAIFAGVTVFSRHRKPSTVAAPEKSIAVLPFDNLSRDPDNAYFATGIQDEILTRIAKIGALKVISRVSTKQYPSRPDNLSEIAHQLGVANILEGSVQRASDQVHVNVQLIRAATDEHLWAESYDRKLENIFGVEAEVAAAVADALKAKLTRVEQHALEQKPTSNPAAYEAYLRGIAVYAEVTTVEDQRRARQPFEEAVALDPNFALAWAMLSRIDSGLYFGEAKPSVRASAQKELENATRLQPNLPEVQVAQAFYQGFVLHDSEHARPILERLLTELPNDADVPGSLVFITLTQGRWDESRVYVDRAIELNPREPGLRFQAALVRETTRDFAGALHCYDEALGVWPDNPYLNEGKARTYQLLGDLDRAGETLKKIHPTATTDFGVSEIYYQAKLSRSYSDAISFLKRLLEQPASFDKGSCRRMLGDLQRLSGDIKNGTASYIQARNDIEPLLKEQPDDADSIYQQLARVYEGLGNRELALEYAQRATTLTPASKDAWTGPQKQETRARIAAHFGQNDLAVSILEHLLKTPYQDPITPAWLQLDPDFDSLRGDPRFQKLVSESESK
jgi:TolB-like protein/tetratricopeptide (TPR) repeat protein/class 3 adenylate cyclase